MTASSVRRNRPPAVLVGGHPQTLASARSIAALGVPVYGVGVAPQLRFSRAFTKVYPLGAGQNDEQARAEWLLGEPGARFAGAVLLACDDVALSMVAHQRDRFAERFLLDLSDPAAQLDMLNKRSTYEIATKGEVPTPRYWMVSGLDDVIARRAEFSYPLLVKPLISHEYQAKFPGKFRRARNADELVTEYRAMGEAGLESLLVELIEGPDSLLCSYFTYLDESGTAQFNFTKRIIRRLPPNEGFACYHITDRVPEVREHALKLFRAAGLRGVANAEFKLDTRDGQLKLIECNARFVGSNSLLVAAGVDLPALVYRRVLGEQVTWPTTYRTGLRMLSPVDDARAMVMLRRAGQLTIPQWLRSIAHRQIFPIMRWSDPGPAIARATGRIWRAATGRVRRVEWNAPPNRSAAR